MIPRTDALTVSPAFVLLSIALCTPAASCPFCYPEGEGPLLPDAGSNVNWILGDSLSACPAGDSIAFTHPSGHLHPSRLRIEVWYNDSNCNPKPKVPPDSIWVTWSTLSGSVVVNDKGAQVFADDSTDALCGHTWVTIPSLSGCGTLQVNLFVSGRTQGSKSVVVRTADTNADGRVTSADLNGICDLNYNGPTSDDGILLASHSNHWRRNALHGTPVQRTSLGADVKGAGFISWEQPLGRRVAFSAFLGPNWECVIEFVPADPKDGNTMTQFSFPPSPKHDYNPSWSPRGLEVSFDRGDVQIYRKGVPGLNPDTSEVLVYEAPTGMLVTDAAFSPNGRAFAFSLVNGDSEVANIYTIPVTGGNTTQVTSGTSVADRGASWSPDGRWIVFHRRNLADNLNRLYKIRDTGDSLTLVLDLSAAGRNIRFPDLASDGSVLAAHVDSAQGGRAFTHTVDATLASGPPAIANYTNFPNGRGLYPRISPDGTRLAFTAPPTGGATSDQQVWAVRRNMSVPPNQATIGDKVVTRGDSLFFYVSATDIESDPLTYSAYYLRIDLGMSFDPGTRLFSWRPPTGTEGSSYWVRFQTGTPSGGTDYEVVKISVLAPGAPGGAPTASLAAGMQSELGRANPSQGVFGVDTPIQPGVEARLLVYDVSGRKVAEVRGPAGKRLLWDGLGEAGSPLPPGVYLYRAEAGRVIRTGKWVLVR